MKRIYRTSLLLFGLTALFLLGIIRMKDGGYSFFIMDSGTRHSVVNDGTLVVFDDSPPGELERYDIVLVDSSAQSVARIMSENTIDGTYEVMFDDFDRESVTINRGACRGKLVFHLNEIGILYDKYLSRYKTLFIMIPFMAISVGFACMMVHTGIVDREDGDFDFLDVISDGYWKPEYECTVYDSEAEGGIAVEGCIVSGTMKFMPGDDNDTSAR